MNRANGGVAATALAAGLSGTLLAGCSSVPLDDQRFELATHQGAYILGTAPKSLIETRYDTVIRQQFDFSCGSAALATLLSFHYGQDRGEASVFRGMWEGGDQAKIQKLGFSLLDMKRYLASSGIEANGYKVTLAQVEEAAVPGIALIAPDGYRHFVVVKGMSDGFVLVGDPALGLRRVDRERFEKDWNGVYFVVTGGVNINQLTFNAEAQWGRLAAFGVDQGVFEPLSQQALNLTAPGYGEF